ncbi:hypothetical protein GCM10012286_70100 [Streptomyces lasiicapitis]|uniref:Uncharacterized protein n=1 Tax=Streptomyces lasiicapitis TaxID=1923961 RepID=A0ABQ2MPL5_9ACTN|nr:hypothetical protein GCM10012286_70100 [Streptomyces lasiicapitis]
MNTAKLTSVPTAPTAPNLATSRASWSKRTLSAPRSVMVAPAPVDVNGPADGIDVESMSCGGVLSPPSMYSVVRRFGRVNPAMLTSDLRRRSWALPLCGTAVTPVHGSGRSRMADTLWV